MHGQQNIKIESSVLCSQSEPMAMGHRHDGLEVKVRFCLYVFMCRIMKRVTERVGEGRESSKHS